MEGRPPKLSHLIWRVCVGALGMRGRLYERHIIDDVSCNYCAGVPKTFCHAIFHCSIVAPIWNVSHFAHYIANAPITSFIEFFVWIKILILRRHTFSRLWLWRGLLGLIVIRLLMTSHGVVGR